jgi:hypothetical protein
MPLYWAKWLSMRRSVVVRRKLYKLAESALPGFQWSALDASS